MIYILYNFLLPTNLHTNKNYQKRIYNINNQFYKILINNK